MPYNGFRCFAVNTMGEAQERRQQVGQVVILTAEDCLQLANAENLRRSCPNLAGRERCSAAVHTASDGPIAGLRLLSLPFLPLLFEGVYYQGLTYYLAARLLH